MNIPNRNEQTDANPVELFIEWSGSKGAFQHYNKEEKKNEELPLPFSFLYLCEMACITGFNDSEQTGYYSNEVSPYDIKTTPLTVKLQKGGTVAQGLYHDIKGKIVGGKYTKSIYALAKIEGAYKIVNIKLTGSGFGNLSDIKDKSKGALSVTEANKEKKGATVYFTPVFKVVKTSEEAELEATKATEKVVAYLKSRGNQIPEPTNQTAYALPQQSVAADSFLDDEDNDSLDNLPF